MTLGDCLQEAERKLTQADLVYGHGTNCAWDEAVLFACHVLNMPADVDKRVAEQPIDDQAYQQIQQLVDKRIASRKPSAYLINKMWFAGLEFYVDERVIVPRSPFAELIIDQFQPWLPQPEKVTRILDVCTGSACIALACAHYFPNAKVDALELKDDAMAVAEKNIQLHHMQDRVCVLQSDMFSALSDQKYDLIISNPPYVDDREYQQLPAEYKNEPTSAFVADNNGLACVDVLLSQASKYLADNGLLFIEVGNLEPMVKRAYPNLPMTWLQFVQGGAGVFMLEKKDLLNE